MHALCRVLFRRPGLHELRTANSPPGRWGSSQGCPHRTVWPSWAIHTPGSYGRHPARAQRHAGQESAHQEAPRAFDLMALGKQPRDSILAAGAGQRLAGMLVQLLSWVLMARGCQSQVGMGGPPSRHGHRQGAEVQWAENLGENANGVLPVLGLTPALPSRTSFHEQ